MRIRVVTLNIWNEEGDSARRLELINRELRALRPDLLALQEVVHTDERSQVADLRMSDAPDVPWFALAALVSLPELGDILLIAPACRPVR